MGKTWSLKFMNLWSFFSFVKYLIFFFCLGFLFIPNKVPFEKLK